MSTILAIDVGGDAIKYALMSSNGVILSKPASIPTPAVPKDKKYFDKVYAQYLDKIAVLFQTCYLLDKNIEGIAVSHAGIAEDGFMKFGGSIVYVTEKYLQNDLSEKCRGLPVTIFNDAKSAAVAELKDGALVGVNRGACFVFGTAVGCGVVCDGKVLGGNSGEVSFVSDVSSKEFFGIFGSSTNFAKDLVKKLNLPEGTTGKDLFEKYMKDKKYADKIDTALNDYTDKIAVQLLNMHQFYEMEKIAIGGGFSRQPIFTQKINDSMNKLVGKGSLYANMGFPIKVPEIVPCAYGPEANLVGATNYFIKMKREKARQAVNKIKPEPALLR